MRSYQITAVVVSLLFGWPVGGRAASLAYTYVSIADITQPDPSGLTVAGPSINSAGGVAFLFSPGAPADDRIFTGNGGPLTTITTSKLGDTRPSINDAGQVSFTRMLQLAGFGKGVFTGNGGSLTTIASDSSSFFGGDTSINNAGAVAFFAEPVGGPGIFVGAGGPITTIADTSGRFSGFADGAPINNGGTVAFVAVLPGGSGIFTGSGGPTTTIADTSGPFTFFNNPSLNDAGIVSFVAGLARGGRGIFTGDGTTITMIADPDGPFRNFFVSSINNGGLVAFQAGLDAPGEQGIYTGPDPLADKVIATGDPLFGSTVRDVVFGPKGLNDSGQIAFVAGLTDRRVVVVRADPEQVLNAELSGTPDPATFAFDPTPVEDGPAGTFSFSAAFCNIGAKQLMLLKSVTTTLTGGNVLLNRDDGTPPRTGSKHSFPATLGFADGVLSAGECVDVPYQIGLATNAPFEFMVDGVGAAR